MPELPEVETTRRGIAPYLIGRRLLGAVIRNPRLRWPVAANLNDLLRGQRPVAVDRRGKYLLLRLASGCLVIHLGMSGSLRIARAAEPPRAHDHLDLVIEDGTCLRLHDPRRFGAVIWTTRPPEDHPLIRDLGPEPWSATAEYLWRRARGRRTPVKNYIMDGRTLVGVGNIYASEALFSAGIRPLRAAGRVTRAEYARLAAAIIRVIDRAIAAGGNTLRDFLGADGEPGYFRQRLRVYGRAGRPCRRCRVLVRRVVIAGRATYYCPRCQR